MKAFIKRLIPVFFSVFLITACCAPSEPVSIVLMIGDGMGFEQVKAAGIYYYGRAGALSFEQFSVKGSVSTYSADSSITDSAASATAIATGHKVNNGVISKAILGDGSNLETILERFKAAGKSTGLVTTAMVTHATPAAFAAHNISRNNYSEIASEIFTVTKPNVLFGGGGSAAGITSGQAEAAGYHTAYNEAEMNQLTDPPAAGLFGDGYMPYVYDGLGEYPTLAGMSLTAFELLDKNQNGFFLMIEGGRIDHACHANDLSRMLPEVKAFSDVVEAVKNRIGKRDDILLIVTADHETGGLSVVSDNGQGVLPGVSWSTTGHTSVNVPVYRFDNGSFRLAFVEDNIEFWKGMSNKIFIIGTICGFKNQNKE